MGEGVQYVWGAFFTLAAACSGLKGLEVSALFCMATGCRVLGFFKPLIWGLGASTIRTGCLGHLTVSRIRVNDMDCGTVRVVP